MLIPVNGEPIAIAPRFELGSLDAEFLVPAERRLWEEEESPSALVAQALKDLNVTTLAVDPMLPLYMFNRLRKAAPGVELTDASDIVDGCRSQKSPAEIALMQQAKSMTLEVHRRAALILRPGIRASEVTRFLDDAHRRIGGRGNSFCIVQFGQATAYPHGLPGDGELKENDLVLIDVGTTVDGYNSDITRTYIYGTPTDEQRRIWDLEKAAQAAAFNAAKPGVMCAAVDAAARDYLASKGLGPDYQLPGVPHRTGHGIGLSIHEAPYLVRGEQVPLAKGMCFSNEPMIVVPDKFGIRLEDHFYITDDGAAWFTEPQNSIDAPFA
jgi:Xaa-Pro dipeptidase